MILACVEVHIKPSTPILRPHAIKAELYTRVGRTLRSGSHDLPCPSMKGCKHTTSWVRIIFCEQARTMANVCFCRQSCTNPSWTMFCLAIRALNGSLLNAYQLLGFTLRSWACHDEACQFGDSTILWSRGRTKLILIIIQKHKLILCKWSMTNATQKN